MKGQVNGQVDGLNAPEKILQEISQFNTFTKQLFSKDLTAGVPATDPQALHAGILGDLASQATRIPEDLEDLLGLIEAARHGGVTDDRKYLLEHIVQLAASLPSDSPSLKLLTSKFVGSLWQGLNHPPLTYLGDEWKYRMADGCNNNRLAPWLGKAGSSYARTVDPITPLPPTLPDAGLVFDELFARGQTTREHPNKVSSMLFYLASIIIHDIFRTNNLDPNIVDNSSYLDLSPLYGNSDEAQKSVRMMKDGKLKPDAFFEPRILGFPPGVAALLCSFNRFHNYVAEQLAEINEGNRFTLVPQEQWNPSLKDQYGTPELKRDNDLFNTARLITCGLYINCILIDYVRTILNLNATHSEWILDPRQDPAKMYGPSGIPEGVGNQVSVEFNLIYRWHSAISVKDQQWTEDFFRSFLPAGADPSNMSPYQLRQAFVAFQDGIKEDPGERVFGGLKRQENGAFKDADLVKLLSDATEDCAGAFGARNVPVVMKALEVLGINQARKWNVATLNEFRAFFGMAPHKTFEDISTQEGVAASLKTLYGSPDLVELYPGLVAEDAKEPTVPGAGLCPGFTISKAILSDAVALVRGDRFYTVDYNATALTNWGYTLTTSNPQIAGGGVMYKLLHRAFPGWYQGNSAYAMYPFQTPKKTKEVLESLGQAQNFTFVPPVFSAQPPQIKTWNAITSILANHDQFKVPWGPNTYQITHHDYMLSGDEKWNYDQHAFVGDALYSPPHWKTEIRAIYEKITMELINENSHYLRAGNQLDVVKDLANPSHALAVGHLFHIPLKTVDASVGFLTAQQYYTMMSVLFAYVFLDVDDGKAFELRQGALQSSAAISKITQGVVELVQHSDWGKLAQWLLNATGLRPSEQDLSESFGAKLIKRMIGGEDGKSAADVTAAIVCTMAAAICTQAQGLAQALDLLMSKDYIHHWDEIRSLARTDDEDSFEKLEKYALECLRLATPAFGLLRNFDGDSIDIDDGPNGKTHLNKGDQVFVNFVACALDPEAFPDPKEIKLDRDSNKYIHHGWGKHACLGRSIVTTALATQLKCLAKCKNLRRAPGPQGDMKYTMQQGAFRVYMKEDWSDSWPFPTTMKFLHDGVEDW